MRMIINDQTNIQDFTLLESFPRFYEIKERITSCAPTENIVIDLSRVKFAFPLFLQMLLILRDADKRVSLENTTSYLQTIHYPETLPVTQLQEYLSNATASYLPAISDKPATVQNTPTSLSQTLTQKASSLIPSMTSQERQALAYMLQEVIDNVDQHARAERLYAMMQAYPKKKMIDICIADNGHGVKESYRRAGLPAQNDREAMINLISACSSKDKPDNESRGYGLFTSRKMTVHGLEGEFLCVSGDALYYKSPTHEKLINVKTLGLKGTVVSLRLHFGNPSFNMYNYLEY